MVAAHFFKKFCKLRYSEIEITDDLSSLKNIRTREALMEQKTEQKNFGIGQPESTKKLLVGSLIHVF